MPKPCIVVALIQGQNGMATWCIEAAQALKERGLEVLLVAEPGLLLPTDLPFEIVRFQPDAAGTLRRNWKEKVRADLSRLSAKPSGLLGEMRALLNSKGIEPSVFLLNGTHLQDPGVDVPQYVAAWAYPTTLPGYLRKMDKLSRLWPVQEFFRAAFTAIGWWRKDWRAYRTASGVLAVTERLRRDLARRGVPVWRVHPGTGAKAHYQHRPPTAAIGLVVACLDLEEPRKRVGWILEALRPLKKSPYRLTLIGEASERFKAWASEAFPGVTFTGRLPREETLKVMDGHDVFIMGSCLDDWGYVVVEAMCQGLLVIAPRQTPFDEIIGDDRFLFGQNEASDLARKVEDLEKTNLPQAKQFFAARATEFFSRQPFGEAILEAIRGGDGRRS